MNPCSYCSLICVACFSPSSMILSRPLMSEKSSIPIDKPETVAYWKPRSFKSSAIRAVLSWPYIWYATAMAPDSFFLVIASSWNGKSSGNISLNRMRPSVVSRTSPRNGTRMRPCKRIRPASYAIRASSMLVYDNSLSSPF